MRDGDIRQALRSMLAERHQGEDALIVDELNVCEGCARVDIAVVNGSLAGYEIKSERDTLNRLPNQIELYSHVFDYVTVVVGPRYVMKVQPLLPHWFGLTVANYGAGGTIEFETVCEPQQNPSVVAASRAQLLWRDEALAILEEQGLAKGHRSKSRFRLWGILTELIESKALNEIVREKLKARGDWRAALRLARDDAKSLQ